MVLDIVVALVIAYGFYKGFKSGLIKTVFSVLALLIGIVAALKLSPLVINLLDSIIHVNPAITFLAGFVITFLIVMGLINYIGKKLENVAESAQVGGINKILGGFGLGLFYAVLLSYAIYFMSKINLVTETQKQQSHTYAYLEPLPEWSQKAGKAVEPIFSDFWNKMLETMDKVKDKSSEKESDLKEG